MSAGAPAIPAPGPFPGSHAPPIGQLRVARRPGRPPSGPLRAFQPQRHTLGTPLKPLRPPSTPFPSAAGSARAAAPALPACSARLVRSRRLDQQSKFDGRSRSLSGQCVHQAGVAVLDGVAGDRPVIEFSNEVRPRSALDGRTPAAAYRRVAAPGPQMAQRTWGAGGNCGFRGQRTSGSTIRRGELSTMSTGSSPPPHPHPLLPPPVFDSEGGSDNHPNIP